MIICLADEVARNFARSGNLVNSRKPKEGVIRVHELADQKEEKKAKEQDQVKITENYNTGSIESRPN